MGVTEDLADALAKDTIEAAEAMGDERLIDEVSKQLGASSQTTQEAFMTAVRVRLAEKRARGFLQDKLKGFLSEQKASAQKAQKG
ncbi:hypothetical protein MHM39_14265 [Phaeobacter sp. CNT1-3]|nr:hypothetical protein [Phaeobacter sp. CNT1-3]